MLTPDPVRLFWLIGLLIGAVIVVLVLLRGGTAAGPLSVGTSVVVLLVLAIGHRFITRPRALELPSITHITVTYDAMFVAAAVFLVVVFLWLLATSGAFRGLTVFAMVIAAIFMIFVYAQIPSDTSVSARPGPASVPSARSGQQPQEQPYRQVRPGQPKGQRY